MPDGAARVAVLSALDAGDATLDAVRASVESWYDATMERVSGVYKRRVQLWLLSIAACVTLGLGADTFQMIATFANNPAVRAEVISQAVSSGSSQPALPEGDEVIARRLAGLSIPFGYHNAPELGSEDWWLWLGAKLPGLVVTMLAISLGAPFWFDVLQKFTNIRAAGQRPKTTASEAPAGTSAG